MCHQSHGVSCIQRTSASESPNAVSVFSILAASSRRSGASAKRRKCAHQDGGKISARSIAHRWRKAVASISTSSADDREKASVCLKSAVWKFGA